MSPLNKLTDCVRKTASLLKSLAKIAIESKKCTVSHADDAERAIIIMGNGPSLSDTIRESEEAILSHPSMSVNFAANADELYALRPRYYILADPIFFSEAPHENVNLLWQNFNSRIDWPMTLFIPATHKAASKKITNRNIRIEFFNPVGVEGFQWLENMAFNSGAGMPRPRNVLIVAIMVAIKMGYKEIYLTGADHSWTRTLEVSEDNLVVTVQPHFYKDNDAEQTRVTSIYKDIRLHQILHSFHVAFKSYFNIRRYADIHGIKIYNATPGSFIDAFERRSLKRISD